MALLANNFINIFVPNVLAFLSPYLGYILGYRVMYRFARSQEELDFALAGPSFTDAVIGR